MIRKKNRTHSKQPLIKSTNKASFVFSAALSSLPLTCRFFPLEFVKLRGFPLESKHKNERKLNKKTVAVPERFLSAPESCKSSQEITSRNSSVLPMADNETVERGAEIIMGASSF